MRFFLALLIAIPMLAADPYLFTSFRGNGESGVYFAISRDGRKWTAVNENKPVLKPDRPGMLMRDAWLGKRPMAHGTCSGPPHAQRTPTVP